MRMAILSDLHANMCALTSCVNDITQCYGEPIEYWCLGDLCGYGPDALETVRIANSLFEERVIAGNHDIAIVMPNIVSEEMLVPLMNEYAGPLKASALMTGFFHRSELQKDEDIWKWYSRIAERYVKERSFEVRTLGTNCVYLTHTPYIDFSYLRDERMYREVIQALIGGAHPTNISHFPRIELGGVVVVLFGHTHEPAWYFQPWNTNQPTKKPITYGTSQLLEPGIHLINPGSVGQPRDHNPKPKYAILESSQDQLLTITFQCCEDTSLQLRTILQLRTWAQKWKELINQNELLDDEKRTLAIHINQKNSLAKRKELERRISIEENPIIKEELQARLEQISSNDFDPNWHREISEMAEEMERMLSRTTIQAR